MTTVALPSTATCPYTAAARVWIRGLCDDATATAEVVERRAADLAADPNFRKAIDEGNAAIAAEVKALREDNRRLLACVNGARETILAARRVGEPGHSAFALGCVLLALGSARDEADR